MKKLVQPNNIFVMILTFSPQVLQFKEEYKWENSSPSKFLGSRLNIEKKLDRKNGQEVLLFINFLAQKHDFICVSSCHKLEKLIRECPAEFETMQSIEEWLEAKWDKE